MASFNNNSYCKPETPAERRAASRAYIARERARVAVLSESAKVKLLARAIVDSAAKRGVVSTHDGIQAGLTSREVEIYSAQALEVARAIEPRLFDMVAA